MTESVGKAAMKVHRKKMSMPQLPIKMNFNLALAALNLDITTETEIQSLLLLIGQVSMRLASAGAAALKPEIATCS